MTSYAISWKLLVLLLCVLQSSAFSARALSIDVVSVTRYKYVSDDVVELESRRLEFKNADYGFNLEVPNPAEERAKSNLKSYSKGNVCFGLTNDKCGAVKFAHQCSVDCKYDTEVDVQKDKGFYEAKSIRHHTLGDCIGSAELTCEAE